jgi:hypothetical protein
MATPMRLGFLSNLWPSFDANTFSAFAVVVIAVLWACSYSEGPEEFVTIS